MLPFLSLVLSRLFIYTESVSKFENKFLKNHSTETKLALSHSKSINYNKNMVLISYDSRKVFKIVNKILPILTNTLHFKLCYLFKK